MSQEGSRIENYMVQGDLTHQVLLATNSAGTEFRCHPVPKPTPKYRPLGTDATNSRPAAFQQPSTVVISG